MARIILDNSVGLFTATAHGVVFLGTTTEQVMLTIDAYEEINDLAPASYIVDRYQPLAKAFPVPAAPLDDDLEHQLEVTQ